MLKKGLSQHLIKDKNLLRKIVRLSNVSSDDVVVEIGAGHGDLTEAIAEKAGYVYAVELDRTFGSYLELLKERFRNVEIIYGDILEFFFAEFKKERNIKVIGNIPYKITGPIVIKILKERSAIDSAFLTMQKEIALRIASKPFARTYGAISAITCREKEDAPRQ